MTTHELKTWPGPFAAVRDGTKTHDIRPADRPYAVGDVLHLREWDPTTTEHMVNEPPVYPRGYTGRSIDVEVTYLSSGGSWGLPANLCVMSIRKVDEASLCGELLESLRLASTTSDGYRDAHAAYQRWAARLAPDAIGDEARREAIEGMIAPRAVLLTVDGPGTYSVTTIASLPLPLVLPPALLEVLRATVELRRAESWPVPGDSIVELEANVPAAQRRSMVALTRWRGVMDEHMPALRAVLGEEQAR